MTIGTVRLLVLVFAPVWLWAQAPVPAERRADTYAIYTAVLANPRLAGPDRNEKYLIEALSGVRSEGDPAQCIGVPEAYRSRFEELQADHSTESGERYRLEREIRISKRYELITEEQAAEFRNRRDSLNRPTDEVELFRGVRDVITLGNVYFDRRRTVAAVYMWAWCGDVCGVGSWRVFVRNANGQWTEEKWTNCFTIAGLERLPVFGLAANEVGDKVAIELLDDIRIEAVLLGPGAASGEHGALPVRRGDVGFTRLESGGGVDVGGALAELGDDGAVDAVDFRADFLERRAL